MSQKEWKMLSKGENGCNNLTSPQKSPILAHGFLSPNHDKKENEFYVDGFVIMGTIGKNKNSGVYGSEPKDLGVVVSHEKQLKDKKLEVSSTKALLVDKRNIASHFSPNVVEKCYNIVS